ncbi:MAG: hypothetical protein KIC47_15980 [Clostridium sp.]|nr:hypothetical protein [Clostridium sp.]
MMENEKIKKSNYNFSIFMGLGLTFGIVFDKLALGLAFGEAYWFIISGERNRQLIFKEYRRTII